MAANPTAPPMPAAQVATPAQGRWTYEDYLRLPDDGKRYEIIDGVLYVANAPSYDHQFAVTEIVRQVGNFVMSRGLGVVIPAPFEVHLPGIAQPVQPDVIFIAAAHQPRAGAKLFEGAPDLIVEVISPASTRLDQYVKFGAYERAGVREYWLADPKTRSMAVYTLAPAESGVNEYALLGAFSIGEKIQSNVLAGIELSIDTLFVPA